MEVCEISRSHDSAECSCKIPHATLIEDENIARFRSYKNAKAHGFGTMPRRGVTSYAESTRMRGQILTQFQTTACSKRSSPALIVKHFSVFARSEAVYVRHFVPLRVAVLHQGSWEGHGLRPTGRNVSGTWMHL